MPEPLASAAIYWVVQPRLYLLMQVGGKIFHRAATKAEGGLSVATPRSYLRR
jgi:hypothetical protein